MDAASGERDWALPALRWVAGALVVLIVAQAALAGQALFGPEGFEVHGYLGNASFALGVVGAAVALLGRCPRLLQVLAVVLLVVLFTQIGLGYSGRTSTGAAAWHVPLGVVALGLASALLTASLLPARDA